MQLKNRLVGNDEPLSWRYSVHIDKDSSLRLNALKKLCRYLQMYLSPAERYHTLKKQISSNAWEVNDVAI